MYGKQRLHVAPFAPKMVREEDVVAEEQLAPVTDALKTARDALRAQVKSKKTAPSRRTSGK